MSSGGGRDERVNSLVRGLEVLKAFGRYHEPMTISEVATETGLTPASARRMLLTLTDLGYVELRGKRFRVGPKVLDLGYSYMSSMPIWQIVQPAVERISEKFSVSSSASVLDGCDIVYAVRANNRQASSVLVSTGTRQPAHVTSMGRVLLAFTEPERRETILSQIHFSAYTSHSVMDIDQLRLILEQVRGQNFSIVDEEMEFGLRAIAVPIRNKRGEVVAAINAAGSNRALDLDYLKNTVLPAMFDAANMIKANLPA